MKRKPDPNKTPAALGFRMPAEWEPHEATWIAWPHNRTDWPGKIFAIQWAMAEMVRKIAPGEIVRILVNSSEHEGKARSLLTRAHVDMSRVEFFRIGTDRSWVRDSGPIFIRRGGTRPEMGVVDFVFNAWARYTDWKKDARVASRVGKAMGLRVFEARSDGVPVVLEGGAIDTNGNGTLVTTEECLLDTSVQCRNPQLDRDAVEWAICDHLGVTNILWLARGIAGDDTHGHVDDLCRFVNPTTVVLCQEDDVRDINYYPLAQNRQQLANHRLEDGSRIEVVPLPMPEPLHFDGRRLPASYANFYIANACVLVPTFNDPMDRVALGILSEIFRDRPVVGIHSGDLIWGFGAIHCLTQQQPSFYNTTQP